MQESIKLSLDIHKNRSSKLFAWKIKRLDHHIKRIKSDSEKQMSDIFTCLRFFDFILVSKNDKCETV